MKRTLKMQDLSRRETLLVQKGIAQSRSRFTLIVLLINTVAIVIYPSWFGIGVSTFLLFGYWFSGKIEKWIDEQLQGDENV